MQWMGKNKTFDFFFKKAFKNGIITGGAFVVALSLFYFMALLIHDTPSFKKNGRTRGIVEFIRTKPRSFLEEKKRSLPQKKSKDKPPPLVSRKQSFSRVTKKKLPVNKLDIKAALKGRGAALGGMGNISSKGAAPLVRINPQYPRKARMLNIEGWVKVRFTITPIGTVTNLQILDSHPKDIFDQATIQAVSKWKYQPLIEDGKAVSQKK